MAAPAIQGTCTPKKGIFPPKPNCPPSPMIIMVAMIAIFLELNRSTFFSTIIAIPWAAMAPNKYTSSPPITEVGMEYIAFTRGVKQAIIIAIIDAPIRTGIENTLVIAIALMFSP